MLPKAFRINTFNKVTEYKTSKYKNNKNKKVAFININNKISEKEIRKIS